MFGNDTLFFLCQIALCSVTKNSAEGMFLPLFGMFIVWPVRNSLLLCREPSETCMTTTES